MRGGTIKLPDLPTTINPIYKQYDDAFDSINRANSMIQRRYNKLKQESDFLKGYSNNMFHNPFPNPHTHPGYQNGVQNLYNYNNLSMNRHGPFMNPNLYANQYMDPIYYPLEAPVDGEPVELPRIEMGSPIDDRKNKGGMNGLSVPDAVALLKNLNLGGGQKKKPVVNMKKPQIIKKKRNESFDDF